MEPEHLQKNGGAALAKESFDKEIQLLRMLVLASGAYNRRQFAERLGISVHTLDKTIRRLREVIRALSPDEEGQQDKDMAELLRYSYYESTEPMLLFLFRAKSLKESESQRLSVLLTAMSEAPRTAPELLDLCPERLPPDAALPDEKTIRGDLKYLEEVGVIRRESGTRPIRYRINLDPVERLTPEELTDLTDFVDIMANTQVPSVQGYLLRDGLRKFVSHTLGNEAAVDPFLYKYHYYSRILDEAHLFPLLSAIRERRKVRFTYFTPKTAKSYASRNTNPRYERDRAGSRQYVLPLKLVYDHQYGRWYLLAHSARDGLRKFRMEGITELEADGPPVEEAFFAEKLAELEEGIARSWLIDTGPPVNVRLRFYHPVPGGAPAVNFVKDRVLLQGQWGKIVEEDEASFVFEIEVNGTMEIRPWVRSFGSSCEVLEPPQLREEMIAEWRELLAYYESVREDL
jgi:predicted DNA-binding transcriptional regulator YafY